MTYTRTGTPYYMAPEVIKREGHSYGADLWALGMLLYEMISGVHPIKQAEETRNLS